MPVVLPAALIHPLSTVTPAGTGPKPTSLPGGWLGQYLRDPLGTLLAVLGPIGQWLAVWWPTVSVFVVFSVLVVISQRRWLAGRRHAALVADARQITVLAPPTVDPAGGAALWSNLVGLLRPAWRRALASQPHVVCEYVFSEAGVAIRLWVPGVIPPGLVERAVEAAWPGSHTRVGAAEPPLPQPGEDQRRLVVGGELRLARSEALPIRTDFDADPIRALIGAPVGLGRGEYACVQILARPVTGRRVAKARRSARRVHTGGSTHLVGRLLDLITPGVKANNTRHTTKSGQLHSDPQTSLEYSAQNRAIVTKQRGSQFETVIRYAVATLLPKHATEREVRTTRDVARGRAHALAASFASYTEHNRYGRKRVRHPGAVLDERRLGRGDLLSVPELAALAHLPVDESIPGVQRAGARAISPPPGIATPARRPSRSGSPTPDTNGRSRCGCPMPAITCTSSAPPAPASPPCWAP
jgi:hypothetical protein